MERRWARAGVSDAPPGCSQLSSFRCQLLCHRVCHPAPRTGDPAGAPDALQNAEREDLGSLTFAGSALRGALAPSRAPPRWAMLLTCAQHVHRTVPRVRTRRPLERACPRAERLPTPLPPQPHSQGVPWVIFLGTGAVTRATATQCTDSSHTRLPPCKWPNFSQIFRPWGRPPARDACQ